MGTFKAFGRVLLGLLVVFAIHKVQVKASDAEIVETTNEVLKSTTDFLSNIDELMSASKVFEKISGFMGSLGPAAMAISAIISIVTMFLPHEDSPELKAIKEGFDKVNKRLDVITSKIGNLDNIIEWNSAKAAFVDSLTIIDSNYEMLQRARQSNNKDHYTFFAKQYENTFNLATDRLYDSLVGKHGAMGFDVVNLYRVHVKCNPNSLSELCTKGMQMIVQGMDIEGAYMGFNNYSDLAKEKAESWKPKLEVLKKYCSSIIVNCENDWKTYAYQQFRDTARTVGGDNQAFAEKLARDMDSVAPQRSWLAIVYGDAKGFGAHTFSTYLETEKIWHENDHCLTVVSVEKAKSRGEDYLKALEETMAKHTVISEEDKRIKYGAPPGIFNKDNDARELVEHIMKVHNSGFVNAIKVNFNIGLKATGGTLFETYVDWKLAYPVFKVIIFE